MRFEPTRLPGAFILELEPHADARGFFARMLCEREFARHGLETRFVQMNNSLSTTPGTLRGMHYQAPPFNEAKVVRCIAGAVYDVIVDLRPDSPAFTRWIGIELSAENRRSVYVPYGCAHGFLTVQPETEMLYLTSAFYDAASERGIRFDDPRIDIAWPAQPRRISDKDRLWPDFAAASHGVERFRGLA